MCKSKSVLNKMIFCLIHKIFVIFIIITFQGSVSSYKHIRQEVCQKDILEAGLNLTKRVKININYTQKSQNETVMKFNDCKGNLTLFRQKAPLIITKFQKLYVPTSEKLNFRHNEKITLACTGNNNKFASSEFAGTKSLSITCRNGQYDTTTKNYTSLDSFLCAKDPSATVLDLPDKKCAKNEGHFKVVAFQLENRVIPLYKSCYSNEKWETIYTVHNITGTYWQEVCRMDFLEAGLNLPKRVKMNIIYTQKSQNETVIKFNGNFFVKYFLNSFLVRGHLAPAGDFNYCATQLASFYLFNVVPQWSTFNCGKWLQLENTVRKLKRQYNETFTVYTGTYEVLTLKDFNGQEHPIYLADEQRVPVPKYFWKVLYGRKSKAGVAFVALNNIHTNDTSEVESICSDICARLGFKSLGHKTFITCCDIQDIRKTVTDRMSDIPEIKKLLYFK